MGGHPTEERLESLSLRVGWLILRTKPTTPKCDSVEFGASRPSLSKCSPLKPLRSMG